MAQRGHDEVAVAVWEAVEEDYILFALIEDKLFFVVRKSARRLEETGRWWSFLP